MISLIINNFSEWYDYHCMLCIARAEWADQSSLAAADMSDIYSGQQNNMHSGQQYQYSWSFKYAEMPS